ncbi:hypothetical protein C8Q75DRAFT_811472 [Abortiporus biennis]|nr:hypothetical protein C8Q75DRAFT_811472 [Abortiporus biennis]
MYAYIRPPTELVKALSECYNNGVIDHTKIPRELPEHLRVPAIGVYAAAQPGAKPFDVAAGPIRLEGHLSGPHDHIIKGQVKLNLSAPIHKVLVNFEGDVSQDNGLENGWDIAGIGSGHIRVTLRGKKVVCVVQGKVLRWNIDQVFTLATL